MKKDSEKLWGCSVTFVEYETSNYGVEIIKPMGCMFRSKLGLTLAIGD